MKLLNLSELEGVATRSEEGAWVNENPHLPGLPLKVRAPFNSAYNALWAELSKPYSEEELKTDEVREKIDIELLVETILMDWGIADTPFSKEVAREMITKHKAFRRAVNYASNNVAKTGVASMEEAAKN